MAPEKSVGGDAGARSTAESLEGPCFLATCSRCGATRLVGSDPYESGADFVCSLSGAECEGAGGAPARGASGAALGALCRAGGPAEGGRPQLPSQCSAQIGDSQPRAGDGAAAVRYLDGEVVSWKGERYVVQRLFPEAGRLGCSVGGIIGSHKLGRRGLGFRKRSKAEVDKVCLSNRQRVHTAPPQPWCTSSNRSLGKTRPKFRAP